MSAKRLLLVVALALLAGAVVFVCLAPIASPALRLWLGWSARQQNVDCTWTSIDAPLFRPVVVRNLKVRSRRGAAVAISLDIDRAELDLHLAAFLNSSGVRALRQLKLEGVRGEVRYPTSAERTAHLSLRGWRRLIADNFVLSFGNLRISRGDVSLELHDVTISASEIESGHLHAGTAIVNTPWFRKTFAGLRGATSWQYDRLTIGAISLAPGLDLDAITFDFAHLGDDQLRVETSVDAFGGKLRSSISTRPGAWDVAATATQISLAQASDGLGLSSRAAGTIQSSKFTFSGDPQHVADATASIWAEAEN
ncbi:MAG: hypothetical protein M3Z64_07470, partial [Verrucomicrobiota bacterium]|nr:hypothetical protein [Verrucomicrobiota bacterium]